MNKTRVIALFAIAVIMLVGTMTLAPVNVKATTEEDNDDDDDGPALTMNKESSNPSGEKVKDIQSNENSENAAIKIERSQDHSVRQASAEDEPALTSTRTVERGDTITQITRESAEHSQAAGQDLNREHSLLRQPE